MDDVGRQVPPSPGRVDAAGHAGLLTGSPLVSAGLVLLTGAAALWLLGPRLAGVGVDVVRGGLDAALALAAPEEIAMRLTTVAVGTVAPLIGAVFAAALLLALWRALGGPRGPGSTAVPLPRRPRPGAATLVVRVLGGAVLVLLAIHIWRSHAASVPASLTGQPVALGWIGALLTQITAAGGVVFVAVGLAETAITRRSAWRALHLTASEARRERRAREVDPRLRGELRRRREAR